MKKRILIAIILASFSPSLWAISYDANLPEGVYYGSGNANGSWTVDMENGIELGLRTHQDYPTPANVFGGGANGVYSWTDNATNQSHDRSSWNYDFSINVAGTGDPLSDFTFRLYIDSNPGPGDTWTVIDPTLIPDDASPGHPYGPTNAAGYYAQNSENAMFNLVGIPGYNNTVAGSYDFALFAYNSEGVVEAETYMRVNVNGGTATGAFNGDVTDTGTTLGLLGLAVTGLVLFRRKFGRVAVV